MRLLKTLAVSSFLLIFCTYIFAQKDVYPNELEGFRFFGNGKLEHLKLLVSSKDEVMRIFGSSCENPCDFDENWTIKFEYFDDVWIKESSNNNGEKRTYLLDSKFVGKTRSMILKPKNRVSFVNKVFPAAFERVIITSTTDAKDGRNRATVNDAFQDANGLTYELFSRTNYDDIKNKDFSYEKGDLVLIRYNITKPMEKNLFVLQK